MLIAYSKTSQAGLTLIEAMIACTLVAIVATVGLPWYGDHVRRSRVAEGADLASLARVKAAELVTIGQVTSSGVQPMRMYSPPMLMEGQIYVPPEPASEVISANPSSYVTQILRIDASYVVTFSPKLDPTSNKIYSLVYESVVDNGRVTWNCLADNKALDALSMANSYSRPVDLGDPLPRNLAPAGCDSGDPVPDGQVAPRRFFFF